MASSMLIDMKLPEPYWALAQKYAALIYNHVPPNRNEKGARPMSPVENFGAKGVNPDLFHIFGSRCFCHIDKSLRRKNHRPKSLQCIFVGLDPQSVNGFVVYSPERHDLFVSTHVRFHDGLPYDGRYTDEKGFDVVYSKDNNVISDDVNKFMYLVGTNHVDPDDGLLYKIISVEEKKYPGQGTLLSAIT